MRDLRRPQWMWAKAAMFLIIGLLSGGLIIAANPTLQTITLLLLAIWSFCRLYYFAFYVIEKYIDPQFKFSGLFAALRYFTSR